MIDIVYMDSEKYGQMTDKQFAARLERQANDGHGWNNVREMLLEAADRIRWLTERCQE